MKDCKILVIDDDIEITQLLKILLSSEGFAVTVSTTAFGGLELFKKGSYSLVILDLGLPDLEGEHLCKLIRKESDVPIIILSAKENVTAKVLCFEYGADDYITKPFENIELLARVKAIMRRCCSSRDESEGIIEYKGLKLDTKSREATFNGEKIDLTPKEYDVLLFLLKSKGQIVSREQIVNELWGKNTLYKWSRSLDVHVQHIRSKLSRYLPDFIKTVSGVGYKIDK
ncbi:MAG: two-component system, OmpR family, alkaline phosphatase synthesis response regulator PhoP [Deferribacteres bacterium]|jgi:two-component system alkaline phosphatase synthesis response regulator PhoP|nr:two component transcriptional regulator, winged helix family [Deferribacteraceae bacterium]MDK2793211.1 two-component system, OmpR family, alkaline phosphatase synthesis response regulator PhoP [Deferribacteres bacterium]